MSSDERRGMSSRAHHAYAGYHERPELCRCPGCMAHLESVAREHQAEAMRDTVRVDAAKLQALREAIEVLDRHRVGGRLHGVTERYVMRGLLDAARELVR